jgi:hypothetical protein
MLWPELIKKTNAKGAKIDRIIEFILTFRLVITLVTIYYTNCLYLLILICCFVHTLPFFPNRKTHVIGLGENFIVALCWVGVTLVLPLLNANVSLGNDFYLKCVQRFILIFNLILVLKF